MNSTKTTVHLARNTAEHPINKKMLQAGLNVLSSNEKTLKIFAFSVRVETFGTVFS